jgi:uroporphyrinogen decarboxylase
MKIPIKPRVMPARRETAVNGIEERDHIMQQVMTPKERAVAALELRIPDFVPHFELEFQLAPEMFGRDLIPVSLLGENLKKLSQKEKEKELRKTAEFILSVYTQLEYSIIPGPYGLPDPETALLQRYLRDLMGNDRMIGYHGDGTFSIPDGNEMCEFAYALTDDPDSVRQQASKMADEAIERNKRRQEDGVDVLLLCADYCYNSGPFISPAMFREFVQPYLARIIEAARKDGLYTIKHTDGNIMPIIDQLVECNPHALHSLDPMAGVDIREVKRLYGDKVCLCGNVHCAALQTGTDEEVTASAEYAMTYGKPGGGYMFTTSNIPFKGMPPERYRMILDVWKRMRNY